MVNLGMAMQACAIGLFGAWVLVCYPPAPGEALWELPAKWLPAAGYIGGEVPLPPLLAANLDTMADDEYDHVAAPGEGSVISILHMPEDPTLVSERERQQQIDAWVHQPVPAPFLDWSPVDEAVARFLAPVEGVDRARVDLLYACNLADTTIEIPRIPALIGASA